MTTVLEAERTDSRLLVSRSMAFVRPEEMRKPVMSFVTRILVMLVWPISKVVSA